MDGAGPWQRRGRSRVEGKENDKSIKIEVVENKRDEMMVLKIGFDV